MANVDPATVTAERLCSIERSIGAMHRNVPRRRVSPYDRRKPEELAKGGMQGGDRMRHHGYAKTYAEIFRDLAGRDRLVLLELGILRGAGLAMLSQLFPEARIIGLDVDLSHFNDAKQKHRWRSLMSRNLEVYCFDELDPTSWLELDVILGGDSVDLFIDDALHTREASLFALHKTRRIMAPSGYHVIEDTLDIADEVERSYGIEYRVTAHERLTVIQGRPETGAEAA